MNRRQFLEKSSLATVGTMLIPNFLKALEKNPLTQTSNAPKNLIIIQLGGGNDGLNTVVPFQNDIYYRERPRLAIPKAEVLQLNDELGFNPVLKGLKNIYEQGYLSIINNVGYPNPDRSHFRSMDIWHTASNADEYLSTGWLGRYLDNSCEGNCKTHTALEIDGTLSLAVKGEKAKAMALKNAKKLYKVSQSPQIQSFAKIASNYTEKNNVSYLYKTLAETNASAEYIYEKSKVYQSKENYPPNDFGKRLKTISEFINSGLDTRIYYASLSGFDTHVNQKVPQERLLKIYSESIESLVKDLKKNDNLDNTIIMTFSEFGRRVKQNASNGTDHGTANNVFIIGGKLQKAGIYNESPNLNDLDKGDLKHKVDFRQIYATLLKKYLQVDDKVILGRSFQYLDFV